MILLWGERKGVARALVHSSEANTPVKSRKSIIAESNSACMRVGKDIVRHSLFVGVSAGKAATAVGIHFQGLLAGLFGGQAYGSKETCAIEASLDSTFRWRV